MYRISSSKTKGKMRGTPWESMSHITTENNVHSTTTELWKGTILEHKPSKSPSKPRPTKKSLWGPILSQQMTHRFLPTSGMDPTQSVSPFNSFCLVTHPPSPPSLSARCFSLTPFQCCQSVQLLSSWVILVHICSEAKNRALTGRDHQVHVEEVPLFCPHSSSCWRLLSAAWRAGS